MSGKSRTTSESAPGETAADRRFQLWSARHRDTDIEVCISGPQHRLAEESGQHRDLVLMLAYTGIWWGETRRGAEGRDRLAHRESEGNKAFATPIPPRLLTI